MSAEVREGQPPFHCLDSMHMWSGLWTPRNPVQRHLRPLKVSPECMLTCEVDPVPATLAGAVAIAISL